jgi:Family of unknown function (DUF6212)
MTTPSDNRLQIAVLAPETLALPVPGLEGIEWLRCRRSGEQQLEFHRDGAPLAVLDFEHARFDLPNLLAIIVVGVADECATLRASWVACFPALELGFACIPELTPEALASTALACLADELVRQRLSSGRAALDLAVYRAEFERLQHSFSRLEEFVSQHSLQEPRVLFEYAATAARFPAGTPQDSGEPGARRLLQRLPVDSLGVAGVAIDFRTPPAPGTAIGIGLYGLENDRTYAEWSIDSSHVPTGWLHLALNRAIDEPDVGLLVIVDLPAGLGHSALAFGQPHPYEEFRAYVEGGEPLHAPLALRIYGGLPGVRVPATTAVFPPKDAPPPPLTLLSHDIYQTVRQVFPPPERSQPNFVSFDPTLGSITVHPREGGTVTAARMDLVVPAHAWRCSAQIALAHELAQPTEFALLALPLAANGSDAHFLERLDESAACFSGWIGLAALQRKRVSVFLPRTHGRTLSLYLLTRQAPDASADFAWARFAAFEFNTPPRAQRQLPGMAAARANSFPPEEFAPAYIVNAAVGVVRPDVEPN